MGIYAINFQRCFQLETAAGIVRQHVRFRSPFLEPVSLTVPCVRIYVYTYVHFRWRSGGLKIGWKGCGEWGDQYEGGVD